MYKLKIIEPQLFKIKISSSFPSLGSVDLQEKIVEPSKEEIIVMADASYDGLSKVTIEAVTNEIDNNIQPSNIKLGVSILGVEGNLEPDKPDQDKSVTPTKETQEILPDTGYELASVTVNPIPDEYIIPSGTKTITENGTSNVREFEEVDVNVTFTPTLQDKTVTPTEQLQEITADTNYDGLGKVSVNAIPSEYIVPSGTLEITENGEYDVGAYNKASVNVESGGGGESSEYNAKVRTDFTGMPIARNYLVQRIITELPTLDLSGGTNLNYGLAYCSSLRKFPQIIISNAYNFNNFCRDCVSLEEFPQLNTQNGTIFDYMCYGCTSLSTMAELNFFKATNLFNMLQNCTSLANLGGFVDLGRSYSTTYSANNSNYRLDLSACPLTEQSIINVLTKIYDIATKGCNTQSIILGSANLAKLTSPEGQNALTQATNYGWTIS